MRAAIAVAKIQLTFVLVIDSAELRLHQRPKQLVHEIEQPLAAAKILGQTQGSPLPCFAPRGRIALKYSRVRLAKAIDALLHVSNHEAIGLLTGPAQRAKNL